MYGVTTIPSYIAKSTTTAYYQPGSPDAARPGYFYVNTYDLSTRPKWKWKRSRCMSRCRDTICRSRCRRS